MRRFRSPFGSKLGAIYAGVLFAVLVSGVTAWLILDLRQRTIAARKGELARFATLIAEVAERALQAVDFAQRDIMKDIRQNNAATTASFAAYAASEPLHAHLLARIADLPQADGLTIIGADGKLLNTTHIWPTPGIDLSDRPYFQRARSAASQDEFIDSIGISKVRTGRSTFLVRRISDPDGHFLGVMLGSISPDYFETLSRSILPTGDSSINMALGDGTLVFRYPAAPAVLGKINTGFKRYFTEPGIIEIVSSADGRERYFLARKLTRYSAHIAVAVDKELVLAPWRKAAIALATVAILLDLTIAGGVALMLREIRRERQDKEATQREAANATSRERERAAAEIRASVAQSVMVTNLATAFEQQVGRTSQAVAAAVEHVQRGAIAMTVLAADATGQTHQAAAEAAAAAAEVLAMVSAVQAMTGSIENVASQSLRGAELTSAAARTASDATQIMTSLTTSAEHIGEIINTISFVARQTNMLALNATIEAARAGPAGLGFAVVASEVKALARTVSNAAEDVKRQINGMQAISGRSAAAMAEIGQFVTSIDAITHDITQAMERQHATTMWITGKMIDTASGTRALSDHIGVASGAATQSGSTARAVQTAADNLTGQVDALRSASADFLVQVHAARPPLRA